MSTMHEHATCVGILSGNLLKADKVAPTFDPAAWFAMWSDHGGVAMMIGDRLWVGRTATLDRRATEALNAMRGQLHAPGAANALAGLLLARGVVFTQSD